MSSVPSSQSGTRSHRDVWRIHFFVPLAQGHLLWIFYSFEVKVTLAVLTQGLLLCTASISQKNAAVTVATVERHPTGVQLTLILASIRVFVTPIWAICGRIANLLTTKELRLLLALIEAILLTIDWSKSLVRMCSM